MARQTAKLDKQYDDDLAERLRKRVAGRFTIQDLSILTGWSKPYFITLEQDGLIPKSKIVGTRRSHRWTKNQAKVILEFAREQQSKRMSHFHIDD